MGELSRRMNKPEADIETMRAGFLYGQYATWLNSIPRFRDFETYIQTALLKRSLTDGIKAAQEALVGRLKRRFDEVDRMTMPEVMEALQSPMPSGNQATAPAPPPGKDDKPAQPAVARSGRARPARSKPGDARIKILSALESLAADGEWTKSNVEIAKLARVPRSTYHRVVNNDEQVKKVMAKYNRQRLGRGPSYASDL
jgi:hypothetical protein